MAQYKQVEFFCGEQRKRMVCDSPEGPSVLMALYNYALLSIGQVEEDQTPTPYVAEQTIRKGLKDLLALNVQRFVQSGNHDADDLKADEELLLKLIESLASDHHVTPLLDSVSAFEPSNLFGIFNYLGVPLLYGWLVNPADKTIYESIRQYSYEGLLKYCNLLEGPEEHLKAASGAVAQKHVLIQDLLHAGKKQSTTHGYVSLCKALQDGDFAVVYRDNKFSIIHKNDGVLLFLETEVDILSQYPTVRWRVFEEVERERIYLTSRYFPAKDQPNVGMAKAWYQDRISKVLRKTKKTSNSEKRSFVRVILIHELGLVPS